MKKVSKEQMAIMDATVMIYDFYNEAVALKLGTPFAFKQAEKSAKCCVDNMLSLMSYMESFYDDDFSNDRYNDYVMRIYLMSKEISKIVESHDD